MVMSLVPCSCGCGGDRRLAAVCERAELDRESPSARRGLHNRAVDPVHDGAVVFARAAKAGLELLEIGYEQVVADEKPERMQQWQRVDEARHGAVRNVKAYVAVAVGERLEHLSGDAGADLVVVEWPKRGIALSYPHRRPDFLPEGGGGERVGEEVRRGLRKESWAESKEPARQVEDLLRLGVEPCGYARCLVVGDVGAHLDLVEAIVDDGELVSRQVVVD